METESQQILLNEKREYEKEQEMMMQANFQPNKFFPEPELTLMKLHQGSREQLKQYKETCFFILQFTIDNKLTEKQINNLKKIFKVN